MIQLVDLSIRVGQFRVPRLNLSIEPGEYVALMGKTGCGKTTLLETICGLRKVEQGRILIGQRDVTSLQPALRQIGYVPQDLALFPTMTVEQHLQFALQLRKNDRQYIIDRTQQLAQQLSIQHLMARYPQGLSGGEAQRVALGRALSFQPPVLLLDEPLSALDDETHQELVELLKSIRDTRSVSVLHVTHSRSEASALADRVVQLSDCCAVS